MALKVVYGTKLAGLRLYAALGILLFLIAQVPPTRVQASTYVAAPALVDNMDGDGPVLMPLPTANRFIFSQRTIDRKRFQHGRGAEFIQLRGPAGQAAQLAYTMPSSPVIQELKLSAMVLSNRAGIQLAAKVVLPRSINQSTGRPYELLVRGTSVSSGGGWEEITLENVPQLLANHARVARVQFATALDERGAYVSQLVILASGGTGTTELLVDQIQVFGVLTSKGRDSADAKANIQQASVQQSLAQNQLDAKLPGRANNYRTPRIPRIIQWRGEPFELLKKIGFNTIGMSRQPTANELQQATQLGLFLICPPPSPQQLSEKGIGSEFASVLAWDLGDQLSSDDLARVERWEQLVTRHDPISSRPTVLAPQLYTLEASRITDALVVGRAVLGTDLTVREYTAWLSQRQRLARPGTPIWTKIETELSRSHQSQAAAISAKNSQNHTATYAQLTKMTSVALEIKTRGYYFSSESPLSLDQTTEALDQTTEVQDATSQQRSLSLELTNLRLQLCEAWLASGKELSAARSSQPELSALVMQTERSHLLVPMWWSDSMQSTSHARTAGAVSFVVPGVAESSEAFLVTLGGVQRLRHKRVTGGIRIELEQLPFDSFLMFSEDPRAISQVTQYVRRIAPRATKVRRDLAKLRLQELTKLLFNFKALAIPNSQSDRLLEQAQGNLAACDRYLETRNYELAYLRADDVDRSLDQLERELHAALDWTESTATATIDHAPLSLPDRMQLYKSLARAPLSTNMLAGGGFESLPDLLEAGWRHKQLPLDGITSAVRLSPEAPHSGSYCLELEARPLDQGSPTTIVPTTPVWISSAPLQIRAGQLLEITGVARMPNPLIGSVDGLQIIDSLGGPDMAMRIHESPSWRPFRLIRAAPSDANVSVTIALSGLGKAQIDDIAIRVIEQKMGQLSPRTNVSLLFHAPRQSRTVEAPQRQ